MNFIFGFGHGVLNDIAGFQFDCSYSYSASAIDIDSQVDLGERSGKYGNIELFEVKRFLEVDAGL